MSEHLESMARHNGFIAMCQSNPFQHVKPLPSAEDVRVLTRALERVRQEVPGIVLENAGVLEAVEIAIRQGRRVL
jgi:hypothetical protein